MRSGTRKPSGRASAANGANGFTTDGGFTQYAVNHITTLVRVPDEMSDEEATIAGPCSYCHTTVDDFRRTGRLGCPHCYSIYETQLRAILRRIHGSTHHLGKVYVPPASTHADRSARLAGLKRKLQRAIEAEDFERAAVIRDQIREVETAVDV